MERWTTMPTVQSRQLSESILLKFKNKHHYCKNANISIVTQNFFLDRKFLKFEKIFKSPVLIFEFLQYICQYSTVDYKYHCCGAGTSSDDVCPVGRTEFREFGTNAVRYCNLYLAGNCPPQFDCVTGQRGRALCCSSQTTGQCPFSQTAVTIPGTNRLRYCSPGSFGQCPNGYSCQFSNSVSQWICCGNGNYQSRFQIPIIL